MMESAKIWKADFPSAMPSSELAMSENDLFKHFKINWHLDKLARARLARDFTHRELSFECSSSGFQLLYAEML